MANPDDPIERNFGIINNFFMSLECPSGKDLDDGNNVSKMVNGDYVENHNECILQYSTTSQSRRHGLILSHYYEFN